ncbi:MAG: hypothetical protein Q8O99_03075 [bacterium]|nr:hypothetical protein [bacterium]
MYKYAANVLPISDKLSPKNDLKELREKDIIKRGYYEKLSTTDSFISWIESTLHCDVVDMKTGEAIKHA